MGIFTREEEEVRVYDGDAFFYFAGTMLLVLLVPWTWALLHRLSNPKPPQEADYDARGHAKSGLRVRRCASSAMESKRQSSLEEARSWSLRLRNGGAGVQLAAILFLWACFAAVVCRIMVIQPKLGGFDPYEILGISQDATMVQIKRAYRTKSLHHHPDKDRTNPQAPAYFLQITKAYAALTDEGARRNFKKYGNPDGPGSLKVGIALHPAILGSRESQLTTLSVFCLFLFAVPMSIVCCCLRGENPSAGGVSGETLRTYHAIVDADVVAEDGPGILAASTEARACGPAVNNGGKDLRRLVEAMSQKRPQPLQPGLLVQVIAASNELRGRRGVLRRKVSELCCEVEVWPDHGMPTGPDQTTLREVPAKDLVAAEPRVPCPFSDPPIRRGAALLWAHMWRLHDHMSPAIEAELKQLLLRSVTVGRAMVSIAANGQGDRSLHFVATCGLIHFRRSLVQALDLDSSPLLQLPHVTKLPGGKALPSLREVVAGSNGAAATFLDSLGLSAEQRLDVQAFCSHVPRMELSVRVEVLDEAEIAEGDLATLCVTLVRANLEEGEAAGPVHAPLYPAPKFEEWWLLVYDNKARRLVTADLVLGTGREEECKIRFMVPRYGEFRWTVHALCDSYSGLDAQCPIHFHALRRNKVNREIFVHPADANIKTLFEELMEGLQPPEEESESEEDMPPRPAAAKALPKLSDRPEEKHPAAAEVSAPATAALAVAPMPAAEDGRPVEGPPGKVKPGGGEWSDDSDVEEMPEGVFVRIACPTGAAIYRDPEEVEEEDAQQLGAIPVGTVVRGFIGDRRPPGWLELAPGGAFIRTGAGQTEDLGLLLEQPLRTVVQTTTPVAMVKRWARGSTHDVAVEDVLQVQEIEDPRVRMLVEEFAREKVGEERFERLLDEAHTRSEARKLRLTKALGHFTTQNGCVWHITTSGAVRGLHPDGSRIRDKVEVSAENGVQIGPFRLDEARTCSCIHWMRKDDPTGQQSWVWQQDQTLQTHVRLGSAF